MSDDLQRRLEEAIVFFFEQTEAGRVIDVAELLARYRDIEPQLRRFLADQGALHGALTPLFRQPSAQPEAEPTLESFKSYRVLGLAGAGGVGAVFRARDDALNRDLAIKVLHEDYAPYDGMVERFIAEAQISAQLQHPGIVPVHEVGRLDDALKRPYFTMKFVKGDTLAVLLAARRDPSDDLARFVNIFAQVCQAVAYAHSKGVLHRDLKPSNVMLGPFGETLVMDWGLGRVMDDVAQKTHITKKAASSVVQTVRKGDNRTYGALGTYAYMPPEQAKNEQHLVSQRSDVFGLGAMLCEILTGQPPYTGQTRTELQAQCVNAELGDAFARLDACGADTRLIDLARACLVVDPKERPADADEVAKKVAAYQDGVREDLRQADLRRAAAEARAVEERKKRDWQFVTLIGAFTVLAIVTLVPAVVWFNMQRNKDANSRKVLELLTRAEVLHDEAGELTPEQSLSRFEQAESVVKEAAALGRSGMSVNARSELRRWQKQIEEAIGNARAARDQVVREADFARALDDAAMAGGLRVVDQRPDAEEMIRRYRAAFAQYAPRLLVEPPTDSLANFSPQAKRRAAEALDHWGYLLEAEKSQAMFAAADRLDGDSFRQLVREAWEKPDRLLKLVNEVPPDSPTSALLLAWALARAGRGEECLKTLRDAQHRHPNSFWLNIELGNVLMAKGGEGLREAAEYYRAAIAVLPKGTLAWHNLGLAYFSRQAMADADKAFAKAEELQPGNTMALCGRATVALLTRQDYESAETLLRRLLRYDPDHAGAKAMLAFALISQGKRREADRWLSEAKQAPDDLVVLPYLFACYSALNALAPASSAAKRIVQLVDRDSPLHAQFEASAFLYDGHLAQADDAAQRGLLRSRHPAFRGQLLLLLAIAKCWQGKPADGEKHLREAIQLAPEVSHYRYVLCQLLLWQGKTRQAKEVLNGMRSLPGQGPAWLRNLVLEGLYPSDDDMRKVEKGELKLSEFTSGQQGEVALAMGKPYLAYKLFPIKPDSSSTFEAWAARWPSGLWNDSGTMTFSHRFNAARAAAMAGCGLGNDLNAAPQEERPQMRVRALGWLRDELKEQTRNAESLLEHAKVRRLLNYCRLSPEFAGVREKDLLMMLPEQEQTEWLAFWKDVEGLLAKLRE